MLFASLPGKIPQGLDIHFLVFDFELLVIVNILQRDIHIVVVKQGILIIKRFGVKAVNRSVIKLEENICIVLVCNDGRPLCATMTVCCFGSRLSMRKMP